MHYTDSWPESAKEALKERCREEVKEEEEIVEVVQIHEQEYWDAGTVITDDESDKIIDELVDFNEQMNLMLKLVLQTNEILLDISGDIDDMKTRLNMAEHGLWEFKDFYCQKNGPFEVRQRPEWE
tara:strand:- start:51 stop:425 length:375 start_codon:yes stop_codon:yes gene_type:complete